MATAQRTRPANRRELIADAAAELFAARGYSGVSVSEIGEAVGISGSALYRHFADKDALLAAIVLDTVETISGLLASHADDAPDDRLRESLVDLIAYTLAHPARVTTFVRERYRVRGKTATAPRVFERRLFADLVDAVRGVAPLDEEEVVPRVVGVIGVQGTFASHPSPLSAPATARFLADALIPVLSATDIRYDGPQPKAAVPIWAPAAPRSKQILDAALPLFRQRGFNGVGIAEVGEAAGIRGPNLYRYIDTKDDILVDIYDRAGARVLTRLEDAIAGATDARDALHRMVHGHVNEVFTSADLLAATTRCAGSIPDAERARLRRRRRYIHEVWRAVLTELRPELTPAEIATLVAAMFELVSFYLYNGMVPPPRPPFVAALAERFLLGAP